MKFCAECRREIAVTEEWRGSESLTIEQYVHLNCLPCVTSPCPVESNEPVGGWASCVCYRNAVRK